MTISRSLIRRNDCAWSWCALAVDESGRDTASAAELPRQAWHILWNNAGISHWQPFWEIYYDAWQRVIDVQHVFH